MSTVKAPLLRRLQLHHLRPSLPFYLYLTSPFASSTSSLYRLLSNATSPSPHFSAVDYLIQPSGLSFESAIQASEKIRHLKSPDNPDSVLQFLRQTGVSESAIGAAVLQEPRLLCSSVKNNLRPNFAKLQEIGLSIEDASGIVSNSPFLFWLNIVPKVDFWMRALGSFEYMSVLLRKAPRLLRSNLENVLVPNLSFLGEQCGLSSRQIVQLIKLSPRLIAYRPDVVKMKAKKAEDLGFKCSSPMFVQALHIASNFNQALLEARMNNLKSLGFSPEELTTLISKQPTVLGLKKETMSRKIEFMLNIECHWCN